MNNNMKIDAYRNFYHKGIWDDNILEYLKDKKIITKEELNQIKVKPRSFVDDPRIVKNEIVYEVWDKKTPVNGKSADQYIKDMYLQDAKEIILFKIGDRVLEANDIDTLKINNNMRLNLGVEDVGELYAMKLNELKDAPMISLEELKAATEIYISATQTDSLNKIETLLTDIKTMLQEKNNGNIASM